MNCTGSSFLPHLELPGAQFHQVVLEREDSIYGQQHHHVFPAVCLTHVFCLCSYPKGSFLSCTGKDKRGIILPKLNLHEILKSGVRGSKGLVKMLKMPRQTDGSLLWKQLERELLADCYPVPFAAVWEFRISDLDPNLIQCTALCWLAQREKATLHLWCISWLGTPSSPAFSKPVPVHMSQVGASQLLSILFQAGVCLALLCLLPAIIKLNTWVTTSTFGLIVLISTGFPLAALCPTGDVWSSLIRVVAHWQITSKVEKSCSAGFSNTSSLYWGRKAGRRVEWFRYWEVWQVVRLLAFCVIYKKA